MNAAFLLVTTAWFAGADLAQATPGASSATGTSGATAGATTTATGPVVGGTVAGGGAVGGAVGGSCCGGGNYGGGCGDCCDTCCSQRVGCLARLRARMQSRNNCCCENVCNTCTTTASSGCCDDGCGGKHGRMRGRRHNRGCCDDGCGCGDGHGGAYGGYGTGLGGYGGYGGYGTSGAMPQAGEPIKAPKDSSPPNKLPSGGKTQVQPSPLDVTPTSSKTIETETKNPFELDRRYESRVGRAADYSWLTGQLFYVHADGGLWVLRYAPLWQEDPNGGSVIFARDRQMDSYREGDLVTVHGEILNQKGSIFLGGPLYRAKSIQLIDRLAR